MVGYALDQSGYLLMMYARLREVTHTIYGLVVLILGGLNLRMELWTVLSRTIVLEQIIDSVE